MMSRNPFLIPAQETDTILFNYGRMFGDTNRQVLYSLLGSILRIYILNPEVFLTRSVRTSRLNGRKRNPIRRKIFDEDIWGRLWKKLVSGKIKPKMTKRTFSSSNNSAKRPRCTDLIILYELKKRDGEHTKNIWRRKCFRRAIFRNVEVTLFATWPLGRCASATCKGSSYATNEYNFFIAN